MIRPPVETVSEEDASVPPQGVDAAQDGIPSIGTS